MMKRPNISRLIALGCALPLVFLLSSGAPEAQAASQLCIYSSTSKCVSMCDSGTQPGCSCIECIE
jgi:hypothetical protein